MGGFTHPNGILGVGISQTGEDFFSASPPEWGWGGEDVSDHSPFPPIRIWGGKAAPLPPHPKSRPSGSAHLRASALSWPDGVCKLELLELVGVKVGW